MSASTPALIAAAAGVGFGHAIMPDHWLPLALVGRTRRYPIVRVARLSGMAGVAHVLVSVLLGGIIIAIGLRFRSSAEHAQSQIVGGVLLLTGVVLIVLELSGRGHFHGHGDRAQHAHGPHHTHGRGAGDHPDSRASGSSRARRAEQGPDRGILAKGAAIVVPFGAAASPDLTILPVFLSATAVGVGAAIGSLIAFAAATIATIVGATLVAALGGYQLRGRWLDRWGNSISAGALVLIGVLVVAGVL